MIELRQFNSREKALEAAADELRDCILPAKCPVLLLLSGGSSLLPLEKLDDSTIRAIGAISVVDERFSRDHKINNFLQLAATEFYKRASDAGVELIASIPYQHESLEAFTIRFRESLEDWMSKHQDAIVVATLGIGVDGHIAGIFPRPEAEFNDLFEVDATAVGYHAAEAAGSTERVTLTPTFLRKKVDAAVFLALGDEKREALQKATASGGSLYKTPARIIQEMKNVVICTDVVY